MDNNGIVENIDVLYLGYAFGSTGPPRPGGYTNFTGQNLAERWEENFPDGINYAFADTDGNGQVEALDLTAIDTFYGKTHGEVLFPQFYPTGADHPPLRAVPDRSTIMGEETVSFTFELGSAEQLVENFYGVAFTFTYDTSYIRLTPESFSLLADSWIVDENNPVDSLLFLVKDDPNAGRADIAIVRRNQQGITGHGPIATATIVIETIVIGPAEQDIKYGVDSVFLIDDSFTTLPVTWTDGDLVVPAVKTRTVNKQLELKVFPNPVFSRQFRLSLPAVAESLQGVYLSDALGRLRSVPFRRLSSHNYTVGAPPDLPPGLYTVVAEGTRERYQTQIIIR